MSQQLNPLEFTIKNVSQTQLEIKVKNLSGAALDKALTIDLGVPLTLLDSRVIDAAHAAAQNEDLPGVSSLAGVVTGPVDWAIWATADMTDTSVGIMLQNFVNQTGAPVDPPTKVEAGAEFTIGIPLNPNAARNDVECTYAYKHGTAGSVGGTIKLTSEPTDWVPDVWLRINHDTPTAIEPRTEAEIRWHVGNGVSATLRGPLPSGNTALNLGDQEPFQISGGKLPIIVVGPATYILQAEVKGPAGKPNVQVVKMLSLDISTPRKHGYVNARPARVLPYGFVEIFWAAWGIEEVTLIAGEASRKIVLTNFTLNGSSQGTGVMHVAAEKPAGPGTVETPVRLNFELQDQIETVKASFDVVQWRALNDSRFDGDPVGLAVAGPKMALLTTRGLYIATVGATDDFTQPPRQVDFTSTTAATDAKAWLGLAALDTKFVVLRQTSQNDLQVALYNAEGTLDGLPVDLPGDLKSLMNRGEVVCDVAVYGGRAYVVVEVLLPFGAVRRAFSVKFEGTTRQQRHEPMLESLAGHRLLTFDDSLYVVNRETGNMFRFSLKANGEFDSPSKVTSAITVGPDGQLTSMIKQGLFASVGRVLAVLSPSSLPSLQSLEAAGYKNVLRYENLSLRKDPNTIPQDLVYNPQHNRWVRCGHGLDIVPGMVCAFRADRSPRLWIIGRNHDTYTLTVTSEHLFAHDYIKKYKPKALPPFLNKKRELSIVDYMELGPLNENCRKAGLAAFSSTMPVEITSPLPTQFQEGKHEKFELRYNYDDPGTVTWRYLVPHVAGVKHDYVFELTLHSRDLSRATTVYKRVTVDQQGAVSIVEVPGTREERSAYDPIELLPIPLLGGVKLRFRNLSPFWLFVRSPNVTDLIERDKFYEDDEIRGEIRIRYDTLLAIYANGLGELPVDVDFGMPMGVEFSSGKVSQKVCVRFNTDNAVPGLIADAKYSNETRQCICTLRYQLERSLEAVYGGDGAPGLDDNYFYVPVMVPPRAETAQVLMISADDLSTIRSASLPGRSVFGAPNSIAVLADTVVAILKNNEANVFDPWLTLEQRFNLNQYDVITNLKGSDRDTKFVMLGMKQQAGTPAKYSYRFSSARTTAPTVSDINLPMDGQPGYAAKPVPGAPAWVSESTIPIVDVNGDKGAMCVEGGLFLIDTKTNRVMAMKLEGVGRQEAVVIDRRDNVVFFAHSNPRNTELIVSRLNPGVASEKMETTTLPFVLTHMGREPTLPSGVNLQYNRPRAVSLAVTDNALVVSHATNISILDKRNLKHRQTINVGLPCRVIQVRRGTLPSTPTPIGHVGPRECTLIWAVGSLYTGDGVELRNYRYKLYKIAVV